MECLGLFRVGWLRMQQGPVRIQVWMLRVFPGAKDVPFRCERWGVFPVPRKTRMGFRKTWNESI